MWSGSTERILSGCTRNDAVIGSRPVLKIGVGKTIGGSSPSHSAKMDRWRKACKGTGGSNPSLSAIRTLIRTFRPDICPGSLKTEY